MARHLGLGRKKKPRVLFVFADSAVWSMASLYQKLKKGGAEPVVAVMPYVHVDPSIVCDPEKYQKSIRFLRANGFKYVKLYDERKKTFVPITRYRPDAVCFNGTMYLNGIKEIFDACTAANVKTFFVSYGFFLSCNTQAIFNTPFQNKMTYLFWESKPTAEMSRKYADNHGQNAYFLGYPKMDPFFDGHTQKPAWKENAAGKKKVIWAPHHSIENNPKLYGLSCFNETADMMLALAEKYRETISFAFRPHPLLRSRLNADPRWGEQKTTAYYQKWDAIENGQFSDGDYVDLFLQSDAMIGDSISFMCEYSAISKPYLFTTRDDTVAQKFNDLGRAVFDGLLYKAPPSAEKIEAFLRDVVLAGNDALAEKRRSFTQENLMPPDGKSACENVFDFLKRELGI